MNEQKPQTAIERVDQFLDRNREKLVPYQRENFELTNFLTGVKLAMLEVRGITNLLSTSDGKSSIVYSLRSAVGSGLSMNPQDGLCSFIKYGEELTYRIHVKGLTRKATNHPDINDARTIVVYKEDEFRMWSNETGDHYEYSQALDDRGPIRGFMAVVALERGTSKTAWMTESQVKDWGERFGSRKQDGMLTPLWTKFDEGAGRKTVLGVLLRSLHLSEPINIDEEVSEPINVEPAKTMGADDIATELEARKAREAEVKPKDEPMSPGQNCGPSGEMIVDAEYKETTTEDEAVI